MSCCVAAVIAVWSVGCAKEATTPATAPSTGSADYKEKMLQGSQAGSETKPGAEVPEPAPEKVAAETTEKPAEDKPTEAKPNETEEKKE